MLSRTRVSLNQKTNDVLTITTTPMTSFLSGPVMRQMKIFLTFHDVRNFFFSYNITVFRVSKREVQKREREREEEEGY
jgi:hypothetical protein